MATSQWAVYAYSATLNQQVRQLQLDRLDQVLTKTQAQKDADVFAHIQNQQRAQSVTDWQPRVVLETHGIDTVAGYLR